MEEWLVMLNPRTHSSIILHLLKECDKGSEQFYRSVEAAKPRLFMAFRKKNDEDASKLLVMKILNLIVLRHEFERCSEYVSARPYGLLIDASNSCPCACPACVHSERSRHLFDWPKGNLKEEVYDAFLDKFGPFAIQIGFFNYGEPFVNKKTPKFIESAKSFGLKTSISSNLSVEIDADHIVESGLDYLLLSIDGVSQGTYEIYRRKGNVELAFHNVRKLVEAKNRYRSATPVIAWQYLVFEHNRHEVEVAREMASRLGINQFFTLKPYYVGWDDKSIRAAEEITYETINYNVPHMENLRQHSLDRERIDLAYQRLHFDNQVENARDRAGCEWLYKGIVADAHGRIFPCCAAPSVNRNLVFAHVTDDDPFNSPYYRIARNHHAGRQVDAADGPFCLACNFNKSSLSTTRENLEDYFQSHPNLMDVNRKVLKRLTAF